MVQVVYVGPDDDAVVDAHVHEQLPHLVRAAKGVPVDVPDAVAFGLDGKDVDNGFGGSTNLPHVAGLLAQPDNWRLADTEKRAAPPRRGHHAADTAETSGGHQ